MAAFYPSLLASGVNLEGRFDQFDLFAGEDDVVTDRAQAADGQAILQFQILQYDDEGRLIPWASTGDFATGTYTVGGQPTAADTITVNGIVLTFRAAPTLADEIAIGSTATITAANIAARINMEPVRFDMSAVSAATVVTMTAEDFGTAGNSITIEEGVTSASFTVSASTLLGASTAEGVPSGRPAAIAAQPVDASTPGSMVPIFIGGVFNHQALIWPSGVVTLAERRMAFSEAGGGISVAQLL